MITEDYKVTKLDQEAETIELRNEFNNLDFTYYSSEEFFEIFLDNFNPKHSYIHLTKKEAETLLFMLNDLIGCPMKAR